MPCLGNADKPCCYVRGVYCRFLVENDPRTPERRWACSLRIEHGNWDDVIADPRYKEYVEAEFLDHLPGLNCRDWPDADSGPNRGRCNECGVNV